MLGGRLVVYLRLLSQWSQMVMAINGMREKSR
jgi:hypothetical protein